MARSLKNSDQVLLFLFHFIGFGGIVLALFPGALNHLIFLVLLLCSQSLLHLKWWRKFKHKIPQHSSWRKKLSPRFLSELQWSLLTGIVFTLTTLLCYRLYTLNHGLQLPNAFVFVLSGIIWSIFINLGGEFVHLLNVIKNSNIRVDQDKNEVIKLKKEVLQDLISPHFLFNSLNTVSSVISENKTKSIRFVKELSDLYLFMLNDSHKTVVSLEEDLNLARKYAFLLQTRLEKGVKINFEVEKEFYNCLLPPMTIQNLVENCVKHNVVTKKSVLEINIYVQGGFLIVKNNLNLKMNSGKGATNLGLNYICSQVEQLINDKVIIIQNLREFVVKIPLIYKTNLLSDESINH